MAADVPVSVLLPVHDGMPYLPECLASLFRQTFTDFELVVVDDESTDDTAAFLSTITDPRLRYCHVSRRGQALAMNYGLQVARAPLIARIDSDDLAEPTRLERQYAYMQAHPQCVLLGCDCWLIDRDDAVLGPLEFPRTDTALRWLLLLGCHVLHPGVLFRREAVLKCGGYDPAFESAEDYALWTLLAEHGQLATYPEKLMRYRRHDRTVTATKAEVQHRNASAIAGRYGPRLLPEIDAAVFRELHAFHCYGTPPATRSLAELIGAFRVLRQVLHDSGPDGAEARLLFGKIARWMGWLARNQAFQNWYRPGAALEWLRAARVFDPAKVSLGMLMQWALRRVGEAARHLPGGSLVPVLGGAGALQSADSSRSPVAEHETIMTT